MLVIPRLFMCTEALLISCSAKVFELIEDVVYRRVLLVQLLGIRDAFHNVMS